MSHFTSGVDAIIVLSYSDQFTNQEEESYQLLLIHPNGNTSQSAWYHEDQLTIIDGDRDRGEMILQEHKDKRR